jgi:hypothetical protein
LGGGRIPVIERAIELQLNTAREILLKFPLMISIDNEFDEDYLDEIVAMWKVEKRDRENVRLLSEELIRREKNRKPYVFGVD